MEPQFKLAPVMAAKKHDCPDCRFCQHCSQDRCNACRGQSPKPPRLTVAQQIARFEALNQNDEDRPDRPLSISSFSRGEKD